MPVIEIARIQVRRGQETTTGMPQLAPGEFGWAEDTQRLFIGKRISEGAVDDNNTRILTELDIKNFNIFALMPDGTSIASTSSYRYQENISAVLHSSTSTIATKLDTWASITDFSDHKWVFTATTEISYILQKALGLQTNPSGVIENGLPASEWAPRSISIPAGNFTISTPVRIPPNTKIIGEGAELTTIVATGNGAFITVDSLGNDYTTMDLGSQLDPFSVQPRNIHLSGITLIGETPTPLLYLDNVNGATLSDIHFGDSTVSTTTNVIGVVIRDTSNTQDASLAYSKNIVINDCEFNGLDRAVLQTTGTTKCFTIRNNTFKNMTRGIEMWSDNVNIPGPVNGTIEDNTFDRIFNEALYIGTATNPSVESFVLSSNNRYFDVGNNAATDASVSGQVTSVIAFNNLNNRSVNDYFGRFSNTANPVRNLSVVSGHAYIENTINYSSVFDASTGTGQIAALFALNEYDQLVNINYTLVDSDNAITSRTGNLTLNIVGTNNNPSAFASVADYYNFADVVLGASNFVTFSTDYVMNTATNCVALTCWNFLNNYFDPTTGAPTPFTTNLDFKYQFNILQ